MKSRKRIVQKGILNHCYQRTAKGVVIFYCISDYLVWFTTFCVTAVKHRVTVLSVAMMPDHLHQSVVADSRRELSAFIGEVTSRFSVAHNGTCHYTGALFEHPYGSAPKYGDKKARTNLIYVGNNPVERRLCRLAEEYRWNFLAFAESPHPFSEPLVVRKASPQMKRAIREVRAQHAARRPMVYGQLKRLFSSLQDSEKEQLVDLIVSTYNVIDYGAATRYFDSYQDMLTAMHASTGSEYDLNEVFVGKSDACYDEMTAVLLKELGLYDIHEVLGWNMDERAKLIGILQRWTNALPEQIAAFLRIPFRRELTGQQVCFVSD